MTTLMKSALLATVAVAPALAADYLPIAYGNTWTYREARSGHEFTVRVTNSVVRQGRTYHTLVGFSSNPLLVRTNDMGDVVFLRETSATEALLARFTLSAMWWSSGGRDCVHEGMPAGALDHEGPAGRFRSVFEIRYRTFGCWDNGVLSEQFAANIGMVRRVVQTFAGPRRYDLVFARVGNQTIDARRFGRFTTSVTDGPSIGEVTATLRLQTGDGPAIRLAFPSSQQYDVALRDATGRVVWLWSADKLFAQAEHEINVLGEWVESVRVPVSPLLQQTGYFVEAWLTTTDASPRFAAATPVAGDTRPAAQQGAITQDTVTSK